MSSFYVQACWGSFIEIDFEHCWTMELSSHCANGMADVNQSFLKGVCLVNGACILSYLIDVKVRVCQVRAITAVYIPVGDKLTFLDDCFLGFSCFFLSRSFIQLQLLELPDRVWTAVPCAGVWCVWTQGRGVCLNDSQREHLCGVL